MFYEKWRKDTREHSGTDPGAVYQAHHIFPQKFASFFKSKGINIHDPSLLKWWETASHLKNARAYNEAWIKFIRTNPSKAEILDFGSKLMKKFGQ